MQSPTDHSASRNKYLVPLWILLLIASGLTVFMMGWLDSMDYVLAQQRGDGIVSLELAWEREAAQNIVSGWGTELTPIARRIINGDFYLIAGYVTLLLSTAALAWGPLRRANSHRLPLLVGTVLLPILAGIGDLVENLLMLRTLSNETEVGTMGPLFTAIFAYAKFALLGLFIALALYFANPALRTIARARFSLLMLVIGIAVLFVPQWQEMLRAMMESGQANPMAMDASQLVRAIWLACASLLAAFSTWYSARVIYMFRLDGYSSEQDDPMANLKHWLPRVLGAAVPLLVALGFFIATPSNRYSAAVIPASMQFVALAVFLLVIFSRRAILKILNIQLNSQMINIANGFRDLQIDTKRPLVILSIANFLFFLLFLYAPEYADRVGAAAVVVVAVALIVPFGSLLVYFSTRLRYPLLAVMVVLAVVFSLINDNHSIRLCSEMKSTERECRDEDNNPLQASRDGPFHHAPGLTAFLDEWVDARKGSGGPIPVFIVSAEGGGIRAAYWTGHVLATLQDKARAGELDFAKHLLAISGVSGGSLGGALFAASVQNLGRCSPEQPDCYTTRAHRVLGEDFLSPTVATLLFPDLLQRFLPAPMFDDRAITLERSWERAWQNISGSNEFSMPFDKLWNPATSTEKVLPPLLLLNSTVVETGQRLIMSPLELTSHELEFGEVFRDALDGRSLLGNRIPLSTAVHLSARFTYVSPAGKVFRPGSRTQEAGWVRLVDGGYFENSGTVTAAELLDAVLLYDKHNSEVELEPFVIHISNEPVIPNEERARERVNFSPIMGELLSPLRALLNVRPARGYQAREYLQKRLLQEDSTGVNHVHFLPCKRKLGLPLGWALSQAVQNELAGQLPAEESGANDAISRYNLANLEQVLRHLGHKTIEGESSVIRETALIAACRG